ncbi:Phosphomannomutase/phosphoglucomutase [Streptomyces hundungensis]|uniref:Phosphomannomutase/phosphoglucomutase n=1 Tax=Streptomyces hundungensis TaxID=1077946 RepID=A0A387HAV0_9ACTN|nr:phosphomannomutase/phosphoglucomutase [Streptomyces hundungensis]AYG79791.1 Phosphomannomutase/phosphoglucomutase [Streptomyces hundungensis]
MADLSRIFKAYDVRGVVPDEWDDTVAELLGAAFAELTGATCVVVGHDMRPTSPRLARAFARGAVARGTDVVSIGLCSTDGLYFASGSLCVPGAMFTASHNPARYNGVKFCLEEAAPLNGNLSLDTVRALAEQWMESQPPVSTRRLGTVVVRDVLFDYADFLRATVDLSDIRPLKVVVDAGNGMAGLTVPAVLRGLPLDVVPLYFELDGTFPHHPANPLDPKNLLDLVQKVREEGADLGVAFDGDADRCFVVDERGEAVPPSALCALIADRTLKRSPGATVIHNLITSRAVPEIIAEAGGTPVRTRVGHSFVKAEMARTGAVFGGEHSAHYYFREFWNADTGMLAALHVLRALGKQSDPLSAVMARYSRYQALDETNYRVEDPAAAIARVKDRAAGLFDDLVTLEEVDGLTVTSTHGWWFNLRPSNTEPLLRLNVEADTQERCVRIRSAVEGLLLPHAA